MIRVFRAVPATTQRYALGEGPIWDGARLLWVDIVAGAVHEGTLDENAGITPGRSWSFDETVGAVAFSATGELLVAERRGVTLVGFDDERTPLAQVLASDRASRLNDGAVDPAGRFLVGSLAQDGRRGEEKLVRLEAGGCTDIDTDLGLSNGLAWSPEGDVFYSVDTLAGTVWARSYDVASGETGVRQGILHYDDAMPDGLCVDAEGNLWIALWGVGRVECRTPQGDLVAVVEADAPHTTCATFAGPDLDVLVITSATEELSATQLAQHPASGCLFTARVGTRGLPSPAWQPSTIVP